MERINYNTDHGEWSIRHTVKHGDIKVPLCKEAKKAAYGQFLGWLNKTFSDDIEFTREYMTCSRRIPYNKEDLVVALTYIVLCSDLHRDPISKDGIIQQLYARGIDTLGVNWKRAAVAVTIAGRISGETYSVEPLIELDY